MRLRRTAIASDDTRTFQPPARLKLARALWELCRFVPVVLTVAVAAGVLVALDWLAGTFNYAVAALLGGVVVLLAGAAAAGSAVVASGCWWADPRRRAPALELLHLAERGGGHLHRDGQRPLVRAGRVRHPALVWWLRALGAKIGAGTWCESYWLPEADLVTLGRSATVNRGCVVQTHLFHDRVMSIDTVTLDDGATIGPHGSSCRAPGSAPEHGRTGVPRHEGGNRAGRHLLDGESGQPVGRPGRPGPQAEVGPPVTATPEAPRPPQPLKACL